MRWSLLGMLVFFAMVSFALSLGRYSPVVSGVTLSLILAIAWLGMPLAKWRRIAYGSVLGVMFALALMLILVFAQLGRINSSTYQEIDEVDEITKPWTPYVVPVGALVGATVATACFSKKTKYDP